MTFDDYLLHLSYLVDGECEALNLGRVRRRGPAPVLHDSEVLTIELAGEFLGLDTDKGIYRFFRRYHRREFPALARVHGLEAVQGDRRVRSRLRRPQHALRLPDSRPL
jgi:hypothetical protein